MFWVGLGWSLKLIVRAVPVARVAGEGGVGLLALFMVVILAGTAVWGFIVVEGAGCRSFFGGVRGCDVCGWVC